ncbi:hypothetical protein PHYBLDRAFT_139205 [Phycomyces blakesleeanus NRRL 1555(-)]|uniref:Uncharacterized protein n=1 Tax=Phycomyces blakesleeanus (strain ATCC 8743b / DSM 1359 / FGSC 10004 / NBRC 33097 / NRRL 1555) TaxID=763407 RepID=A0A167Q6T1_PHYB8|nr:hypothetical protein PHYBLDRAFT_139205 [Phycomyces blakesleeanus NRRL 1555(-)]OAD79169.1 hypothetical protein PHYBLDRAFT_139205 [Phycomyces blakesleeanus NRRL 1555(-)]|eukprot:XP_018297209.1 hypothetical protein PHYBLDRAFT_139205 [Phycomyces blakesleeanus NRRL 1555(-)]
MLLLQGSKHLVVAAIPFASYLLEAQPIGLELLAGVKRAHPLSKHRCLLWWAAERRLLLQAPNYLVGAAIPLASYLLEAQPIGLG